MYLSLTLISDEQTRSPATDKSAGKHNFQTSQLQRRKHIQKKTIVSSQAKDLPRTELQI